MASKASLLRFIRAADPSGLMDDELSYILKTFTGETTAQDGVTFQQFVR